MREAGQAGNTMAGSRSRESYLSPWEAGDTAALCSGLLCPGVGRWGMTPGHSGQSQRLRLVLLEGLCGRGPSGRWVC